MRKITWYLLAAVSVLSISITAFFLGGIHRDAPDAKETVRGTALRQTADSMSEGIKVHGDWELTVSDPDGSNPMVYNFENDLAGGQDILLHLLLPYADDQAQQIHHWDILFIEPNGGKLCKATATPNLGLGVLMLSGGCIVDVSGAQAANLELGSGLQQVSTLTFAVPAGQTAEGSWIASQFTTSKLDDLVPVSVGQMISATVKITFE